MMDDHIALCVCLEKEGAGEHTLSFFLRIERIAFAFALTYLRKRERAKENNYATTNVQSRSKREREKNLLVSFFSNIHIDIYHLPSK